jgi:hypothetical protein
MTGLNWNTLLVVGVVMAFFTALSTPLWLGGMALMYWRRRRAINGQSFASARRTP